MPKIGGENYYTVKELSKMFNVSTQTLGQWRTRGKGPVYVKFGHQVYYREGDLKNFLSPTKSTKSTKKKR